MPITLDKKLAAIDILRKENIFVMDSERAETQAIRPLQILVVNLMPKKQNTEVQLLRHLANTPLQLQVDFLYMASHHSKNTSSGYLKTFYKTFADVEEKRYDGMIVTGAPVETLPFKEVDYWDELCKIFEWSKTHVYSTLHLCWGAQAGIYYHYGIDKHPLLEKLSGIYEQSINQDSSNPMLQGFDDVYKCPHSRYTTTHPEDVAASSDLEILAQSPVVGVSIASTPDLGPIMPVNYFPNDDPSQEPRMVWNLAASTFFSNWINYAVYQETPYDLQRLREGVPFHGYL
ncbi:MAG: homoserine O-succinyltransferase [Lactobacillus sp.]|jgi:homoserine O-succinyltransferase